MVKEILSKLSLALRQGPEPALVNRRSEVRPSCSFRAICRYQGTDLEGTLLDLNRTGLRLMLATLLEPGAQVLVSCRPGGMLVGRQRLRCRVAWVRQTRSGGCVAGLCYQDPENFEQSWVQAALKQVGDPARNGFKRRRMRRIEAQLPVDVLVERFGAFHLVGSGTLLDVSTGGALVLLAGDLRVGEPVRLRVNDEPDSLPVARVVDSRDGFQRISFYRGDRKLDARLERLVRSLLPRT
ncbi:MAG: PilZ domain-containing protein [Armatimonadetes bacterium]|nr:PilZ domain-containing protein [Armatimonadota bacterium]